MLFWTAEQARLSVEWSGSILTLLSWIWMTNHVYHVLTVQASFVLGMVVEYQPHPLPTFPPSLVINNCLLILMSLMKTYPYCCLIHQGKSKYADQLWGWHGSALSQLIPFSVTSSGHYILPLTRATQLLPKVSKQLPSARSSITLHLSKDCQPKSVIADKIHCQFAHVPADELICLLNNAGPPWCEDKELKD